MDVDHTIKDLLFCENILLNAISKFLGMFYINIRSFVFAFIFFRLLSFVRLSSKIQYQPDKSSCVTFCSMQVKVYQRYFSLPTETQQNGTTELFSYEKF